MTQRAPALSIDIREFGTQRNDLRGVVYPNKHDYDRGCRPISRLQSLLANVDADEKLADLKQRGGRNSPNPNIAPRDFCVG